MKKSKEILFIPYKFVSNISIDNGEIYSVEFEYVLSGCTSNRKHSNIIKRLYELGFIKLSKENARAYIGDSNDCVKDVLSYAPFISFGELINEKLLNNVSFMAHVHNNTDIILIANLYIQTKQQMEQYVKTVNNIVDIVINSNLVRISDDYLKLLNKYKSITDDDINNSLNEILGLLN